MRQSFCGTTDPKRVPDIYVTGLGHCRPKVTDDLYPARKSGACAPGAYGGRSPECARSLIEWVCQNLGGDPFFKALPIHEQKHCFHIIVNTRCYTLTTHSLMSRSAYRNE